MTEDYDNPDDVEVIDRLSQVFAPGEIEEWECALFELREVLHTLESANLNDRRERIEADEALFHALPGAEQHLRDAWDTRVNNND